MKLDPAVLDLLNLDKTSTSISAAGGGGCSSASTYKIKSKREGTDVLFFMKTGEGDDAKVMFQGILIPAVESPALRGSFAGE